MSDAKIQLRLRPVIRVFVSSTFSDMKNERNALAADAFPKLEQLCQRQGFQFQAIDLRWGVSTEAGLDHRTMRICFDELRRAQEISPRPNFLILLGNRYGWRPLPEEISVEEFHALEHAAAQTPDSADKSAAAVLQKWYHEDTNAVPPVYLLQSRRQDLGDDQDYTNDAAWNQVQAVLWTIINRAMPPEQLQRRFDDAVLYGPPPAIIRFQASATEQEVWHGALSVPDAREHVLAYFREIENLAAFSDPKQIKDFVDVDAAGSVEVALQTEQDRLKTELGRRLGSANIFHNEAPARLVEAQDNQGGLTVNVTTDHLAQLCTDVESRLSEIIQGQIDEYWRNTAQASMGRAACELEIEQREHERFARERGGEESFVGRQVELKAILDYVGSDSRWPLVIHSASGCGKTALLARASQEVAKTRKRIERFIGVMPRSSDLRSLLSSLCQELRQRNPRADALPTEIKELREEFSQHLQAATPGQPLILFLDALDQLADADNGRLLNWLPIGSLPAHVKLVVSCLSDRATGDPVGQPHSELRRRQIPTENFINLDVLSEVEARLLLFDRWLPKAGRKVSDGQRARIEQRLASSACRQPIFLKLLFEEVQLWHSYDPAPALAPGDNVPELLGQLFDRLSQPANHGPLLVNRVLGYLAASRHGLAENEILEILFADPEYRAKLDETTDQTRHELPPNANRIPVALWSRLRFDLAPYLNERTAPGANVLTFYHRQVEEWVKENFVTSVDQTWQPHQRLADYFRCLADPTRNLKWEGGNPRPFVELPYHMARSNPEKLTVMLFDFGWLWAKTSRGLVDELIADYGEALSALHPGNDARRGLELILAGLRLSSGVIRRDPNQLASQVFGRLASLQPPQIQELIASTELWRGGAWLIPWTSRWACTLTRPGGAMIASLAGHESGINAVAITEDGSTAVSVGDDGLVRVWDLDRLICRHVLSGHDDEINAVALLRTSEGVVAVTGAGRRLPYKRAIQFSAFIKKTQRRPSRDNSIRIWDVQNGELLKTINVHSAAVRCFAAVESILFSGSDDGTIWVMDIQRSSSPSIVGNHGSPVVLLALVGGVISFSEYDFILWKPGGKNAGKNPFNPFDQNVLAVFPQPFLIALQRTPQFEGESYELQIWDILNPEDGNERIETIASFERFITAARFLEDGSGIVVGDGDGKLRSIDISTGTELARYEGHKGAVRCIDVAAGPGRMVSASSSGELIVWDLKTEEPEVVSSGHSDDVNAAALSIDGALAVTGSFDHSILIWETRHARILRKLTIPNAVYCVAASEDGSRIAAGSAGVVRVWNGHEGTLLWESRVHEDAVNAVAYVDRESAVVSASIDGTIKVLDAATGKVRLKFAGHSKPVKALAVALGTGRVYSGDDSGEIAVWSIHDGSILERICAFKDATAIETRIMEVPRGPEWPSVVEGVGSAIHSIAVSDDGGVLVVSQGNHLVQVLDSSRGKEIRRLDGHLGRVHCVTVSADGRRSLSASHDGTIRLWDLVSKTCLAAFTSERALYCCAMSPDLQTIIAGEGGSGKVHFLRLIESAL